MGTAITNALGIITEAIGKVFTLVTTPEPVMLSVWVISSSLALPLLWPSRALLS